MNILLCIPNGPNHSAGYATPPSGTAYIAASLKKAGHVVSVLNFMLDSTPVDVAFRNIFSTQKVDIVAAGGLVVDLKPIRELINTSKKYAPNIPTIIGGGLVTLSPNEAMNLIPTADIGILGEGEEIICEICEAIDKNKPIDNIKGIIYRLDSSLILTPERDDIADIDALPFPDYEQLGFTQIIRESGASVVCSRSCPFNCTFCAHPTGKRYRQRSLDNIFAEIDVYAQKYNIKRLFLSDELFAITPERIIEFCTRIKPYDLEWHAGLRLGDNLTLPLLKKMKEAGCSTIFYGLESADEHILKSMNKKITVPLMEKVLKLTKDAGISAQGNFIFGDVEETLESAMNTINWAKKNKDLIQRIRFGQIIRYPGSRLYNNAVKRGLIADTNKFIEDGCPAFNDSKMTDEEYNKFFTEILPAAQVDILSRDNLLRFQADSSSGDTYTAIWKCPECNQDNIIKVPAKEIYLLRTKGLTCDNCGDETSCNPAFDYVKWIDPKIYKLLNSNKCLFWGVGRFLSHSFSQMQSLSDPDLSFDLCDLSATKQNQSFLEHPILSPDVLKSGRYDLCVVTNMYYENIKREILTKYPQVKVLGIHEIGFYNLHNS